NTSATRNVSRVPLRLSNFTNLGNCQIVTTADQVTTILCREGSSSFGFAEVEIPVDAKYLSFEYSFPNAGDGDFAIIFLDDRVIWVMSGASAMELSRFVATGPIPIQALTGSRRLTFALYGVGQRNAEVEIRNLVVTVPSANISPLAVPGQNRT